MHKEFAGLDLQALFYLLEDCLLRIADGKDMSHYVMEQQKRAKSLTEEIKFRTLAAETVH